MAARTYNAFREPAVNRESSVLRSTSLETIICPCQSFTCDAENLNINPCGITLKWHLHVGKGDEQLLEF